MVLKKKTKVVEKTEKPAKRAAKGDKEKEAKPEFVLPEGRFSFPYLAEPDSEAKNRKFKPDNKYKVDLLVDKKVWKNSPEAAKLKAGMLKLAKETWGDDMQSLEDFEHPLKDTDRVKDSSEKTRGCILIRAKTGFEPRIVGPTYNEEGKLEDLSEKQIRAIKGGDLGRIVVGLGTYELSGDPGINFYLQVVQFKQQGESLGTGYSKALELLGEMEVEMADLDIEGDEDEPVTKKRTRRSKAQMEEYESEETEETETEPEDEDEPPAKKTKGRKAQVEEDEDDDSDSDSDEDEDEEPVRKGKRHVNGKGSSKEFEF